MKLWAVGMRNAILGNDPFLKSLSEIVQKYRTNVPVLVSIAECNNALLEIKGWFEIQPNAWENYWILYHKTNKEASTVLCSVVKHLVSGGVWRAVCFKIIFNYRLSYVPFFLL